MRTKLIFGAFVAILITVIGITIWTLRQQGAQLVREADRFNVPVIEKVIPLLSSWDYETLEPYLHKKFTKALPKEEMQKELDQLSILGNVRAYRYIRHVNHARYKHWLYGYCAVNKYSVSTAFEKGKGVVVLNLNHCYEKVKVTFFKIHSNALPTRPPALQ